MPQLHGNIRLVQHSKIKVIHPVNILKKYKVFACFIRSRKCLCHNWTLIQLWNIRNINSWSKMNSQQTKASMKKLHLPSYLMMKNWLLCPQDQKQDMERSVLLQLLLNIFLGVMASAISQEPEIKRTEITNKIFLLIKEIIYIKNSKDSAKIS